MFLSKKIDTILAAVIIASPQPSDFFQVQRDLADQVITYNLAYLGICVTIILVFFGGFYLFNLKPIRDKLDKQEKRLKIMEGDLKARFFRLSKDNSEQIEGLNNLLAANLGILKTDIDNRLDVLSSEVDSKKEELNSFKKEFLDKVELVKKEISAAIKSLKDRSETLELEMAWSQQYIWSASHVTLNEISSLLEYLEKAIQYNKLSNSMKELCLDNILDALGKLNPTQDQLDTYYQTKIVKALGKIEDLSETKKKILDKVQELSSSSSKR